MEDETAEPLDADQVFLLYHHLREKGDVDAACLFLKERPAFSIEAYHAWADANFPKPEELPKPEHPIRIIRPGYDPGFDGVNPYEAQNLEHDGQGNPIGKQQPYQSPLFNHRKAPGGPDHDGWQAVKAGQKLYDGSEEKTDANP